MDGLFDLLRGNYLVLLPFVGAISAAFFYFTESPKTYQQKTQLRSSAIRNGIYVSAVTGAVMLLHGIGISSASSSGISESPSPEAFTTGPPNF